ncbi:MAG: DUF29 domain-containing protein, partial [Microcystaceae cyanobacterium]
EETAQSLKEGNFQDLDLANLIEEIESMGRRDKREVCSRMKVLLMHLLKWKYQPEKRTTSWISTINEQRDQINVILKDSPSLKPYLRQEFADCYQTARVNASEETDLALEVFPKDCPFTQEQILKTGFRPN